MARVASGDRRAQAVLAARLSGRVRRVSRAFVRNLADADDTAQAALLEILRAAGNYKGKSSIERWADRVVVRVASYLVRQRRRANEKLDFDAELEDLVEAPAEAPAADALARPMSEYLDRLPEPIRMALLLRHTFGYSLEEIGELVEITPNAAKKRVSRGHQAIRRMIRKDRVLGLHLGDSR
jgi:RNA polymerase sigma-70 factor (ECF subfamily)